MKCEYKCFCDGDCFHKHDREGCLTFNRYNAIYKDGYKKGRESIASEADKNNKLTIDEWSEVIHPDLTRNIEVALTFLIDLDEESVYQLRRNLMILIRQEFQKESKK